MSMSDQIEGRAAMYVDAMETPDSAYRFVYQEWDILRERYIPTEEKLEKTTPIVANKATFSLRLQEARIANRLTVTDLAAKVGCSSRCMSLYENGTEMPPANIQKAICQVLHINDQE